MAPAQVWNSRMSLDTATVRRIASLARIRLEEEEVGRMQAELNGILGWIEQLQAVDTTGVEPMAGGGAVSLRMREDAVTDGGIPEQVLANAPDRMGEYFGVPKVVE
jgi:aspartyl-tRNA(Asn)/glutamyl-tRNA(Gln) amidotransferase subunit C